MTNDQCKHELVHSSATREYRRTWCGQCGENLMHDALEKAWKDTHEPSTAEAIINNPPQQHYRCFCPHCQTAFLVKGNHPFSLKAVYCRCGRTIEFSPGLRPSVKSTAQDEFDAERRAAKGYKGDLG